MRSKKASQKMTFVTLAVALGAAVYLNWEYAKSTDTLPVDVPVLETAAVQQEDTQAENTSLVLDALPANGEMDATESADKNYGEAQLVSVSEPTGTQFFEQARLSRTKSRDEALDTLQKSLKNAKLTDEEKESLTAALSQTLASMTAESDIEALVKAKGFVDCVAFLQDGKANITVMTTSDGLNSSEVAQIRDIVVSKSAVEPQNITIVEVK